MSQIIEIEVGDLHAGLHEQLRGMAGNQYDEQIRNKMEELIHETYQQAERQQEKADAIEQKADDE